MGSVAPVRPLLTSPVRSLGSRWQLQEPRRQAKGHPWNSPTARPSHQTAVIARKWGHVVSKSSPYTMETVLTSSRRSVPQCVTGDHGPIANSGVMYRYSTTTLSQVEDGTSHTFLVGESAFGIVEAQRTRPWIAGAVNRWMYGAKNLAYAINSGARPGPVRNNMGFGSEHPGGCHFVLTDGSASFFSEPPQRNLWVNSLSGRAPRL